jgi:hypothetical protein
MTIDTFERGDVMLAAMQKTSFLLSFTHQASMKLHSIYSKGSEVMPC